MKKKLSIGDPIELSEKLFKIRQEIAAWEEQVKPLKEKEDELRQSMLEALKSHRMQSLETERGITYTRASRATLGILDPKKAMVWALSNDCAKVDTVKAGKMLKGAGALPDGFEEKFTDYLQVTGIKDALS